MECDFVVPLWSWVMMAFGKMFHQTELHYRVSMALASRFYPEVKVYCVCSLTALALKKQTKLFFMGKRAVIWLLCV